MSMLRCLYGRVVKCALGEPGTNSISLNVTDPRFPGHYYIINLHARNLNGMTFTEKKKIVTSRAGSAGPDAQKAGVSPLVRNGLMVDSGLRATSLSEGYYRNKWGQSKSRRSSQTNGDKANRDNAFNFNSINVRLLETFGFIGTAVAVGIDVRSRINEWMPYQNRRGIHDFCNYHHHHSGNSNNNNPLGPTSNGGPSSPASLSRVLECFHKPSMSGPCVENDPCLTTIRYCGSCTICRGLFDKLLHLYVTAFPSNPSSSVSSASSILSIVPSKSPALPKVGFSQAESSDDEGEGEEEEPNDADYTDGVDDEIDGPLEHHRQSQLHVDSARTNGPSSLRSQSVSAKENRPPTHGLLSRARQRKKSIFLITEEETEQLQSLAEKSSDSSKSDYISLSESSQFSSVPTESIAHSAKPTTDHHQASLPSPPQRKVSEDSEDIAAVFRMASIEYADQLNNLLAISLMDNNQFDQAMQCWSSCESSSKAFFNMGVAYETGRYAKKARPDLDRAHDCYALAASMGHREAIFNLALYYLYGKGKIEANPERGLELIEAAAAKGLEMANNFIAELNRAQMMDEVRQNLQRKPSQVDSLKRRPLRTSFLRPSASLFGPAMKSLRPKQSTSGDEVMPGRPLKRNNSAPNLLELGQPSPIAISSH